MLFSRAREFGFLCLFWCGETFWTWRTRLYLGMVWKNGDPDKLIYKEVWWKTFQNHDLKSSIVSHKVGFPWKLKLYILFWLNAGWLSICCCWCVYRKTIWDASTWRGSCTTSTCITPLSTQNRPSKAAWTRSVNNSGRPSFWIVKG